MRTPLLSVIAATLATTTARAESPEAAGATVADHGQRMTLPERQLYLQAFVPINLSTDAAFQPVSLAPDVWYGFNKDLTLGLTHSRHAADGFFGGPGAGLCFVGEDNGCPNVIANTAIQARYHLPVEQLPLAAEGGLVISSYDPFELALKLGAVGRYDIGELTASFALNVFFGLSGRTADDGMGGEVTANGETINLPISVTYAVTPELSVGGQTGLGLPLQNTGDAYFVPLAVGGRYLVSPKIHADLVFSLPFLISGAEPNAFDVRVLTLGGGYVF